MSPILIRGRGIQAKLLLYLMLLLQFIVNNNLLGLSTEPCIYRVTRVVEYLGWVDIDLECSTTLIGQ